MLIFTLIALFAVYVAPLVSADATSCNHELVESMPDGLNLANPKGVNPTPTHVSLIDMINGAQKTLRIASFYVFLTPEEKFRNHPSAAPGRKIIEAIEQAGKRGVDVSVVLDNSNNKDMNSPEDIATLSKVGKVHHLNMKKLLKGGVLHSKFLIADNTTFYLGSSNFDWRSYTQIKEIGISFKNCDALAQDLDKIYRTYILMSEQEQVPDTLTPDYETHINMQNPLNMTLGKFEADVFMGASPPPFNGLKKWAGRTDDIDGLLEIIYKARHHIDISVMNYSPLAEFSWPKKYWPRIDDALRRAATARNLKVRLLFSDWAHTKENDLMFYKSLNDLQSKRIKGSIHVKLFKVPAFDEFQKSIPYSRVKHDKYMVTDNGLYIGTSNWAPDYFTSTCGVGLVITPDSVKQNSIPNEEPSIIQNMQSIFDRDFESEYAHELPTST